MKCIYYIDKKKFERERERDLDVQEAIALSIDYSKKTNTKRSYIVEYQPEKFCSKYLLIRQNTERTYPSLIARQASRQNRD